jgi:adenylate cyclase
VEPASGLIASFALLGLLDFADEQRRRRFVQGAFGQYVAPDVVRAIIDDPDRVKLGGERKTITVLFADVRGFTGIAEQLQQEPETLTDLINDVLSVLSEVVTNHHGTIDKYIGDCLMAFWNAPLDDPDHALHGVIAAAEMIEKVRSTRFSGFKLELGVGINSGTCVVGNMGSHARFDYTVLGDAVNVASRIQALTKDYDVPLLIGRETVELTSGQFDFVELGSARVRGKQTEQLIYTLQKLVSQVRDADQGNEDRHG